VAGRDGPAATRHPRCAWFSARVELPRAGRRPVSGLVD